MQDQWTFSARNGTEILLRPAEPVDSCEIIDTIRSHAQERSYVLMEQYGKDSASEEEFICELDRQKNLLLVAVADNEVVGCLAAVQSEGGARTETSHILQVGLHMREVFRGQGIGSKMLEYAIAWAREKGYKKLEASIFTSNKRSLHMFSRAGFTEEGIRKKRICVGRDYIDEYLIGKILD